MARKKIVKTGFVEVTEQATVEVAETLAGLFDNYTIEKFGSLNPPLAYITPSGIRPLDALLGGGFISSAPITFSSTPETGKSTVAFQMAKQFLKHHENGLCIYVDVEATGSEIEETDDFDTFQESRAKTFGLDTNKRFRYSRRPFSNKEFFEYIDGLIELKRKIQADTGSEIKMLIILDSISTLTYSKLDAIEEFDKIPGKRAAELSFYLTKLKQNFAYDRISMIVIDQMKAAMTIKSQYDKADEKTVGQFNNTKAATGVYTFQHAINQWLYFSKGVEISEIKHAGWKIDGWVINVLTEKNKVTSSKHEISVVFDKRNGIDTFWSEFYFISNYTPSEMKLIRGGVKEFMPLCILNDGGAYSKLEVFNPESGEVEWSSKGFYKKNAKDLYDNDPEFKKWFDIAVDYSCKERISKGLLKIKMENFEDPQNENPSMDVQDNDLMTLEPKKRGRKKKDEAKTFAPSGDDSLLESSEILLEG